MKEKKIEDNPVLARMKSLGIKSVAELCRKFPKKQSGNFCRMVSEIINGKKSPLTGRGLDTKWNDQALAIAGVLQAEPGELFVGAFSKLKFGPKFRLWIWEDIGELDKVPGVPSSMFLQGDPEAALERRELQEHVRFAIRQLRPLQRYILLHAVCEEWSIKKIAHKLGRDEEKVRRKLAKALRKMRKPAVSQRLVSFL